MHGETVKLTTVIFSDILFIVYTYYLLLGLTTVLCL